MRVLKTKLFLIILLVNFCFFPILIGNGLEFTTDSSFLELNSVTIVENWNYTSANSLVSPVVADINSDGYLEVLFGDTNDANSKSLFCLDYTGTLLWDYESNGAVWDSPTVADLNKDNEFEILFGLSRGTDSLVCLHSDGSLNWAVPSIGYINWMPVVADINLDGYQEVIVTNTNNIVFCYDYTGTQIWNNTASFNLYGGVAIGDLHDDFGLEIVFGYTGNTIYCLNSTGDTIQSYNNGDNIGCVPIIADLNNTGSYQTLYQSNGYFRCLGDDFTLKWQYDNNLQHGTYSVPSVADINNDSLFEVIVMNTFPGYTYPYLCSLNSTGHEQWKYNITGDYGSSAVIGDIENDDIVDIIFVDNEGHIYCLDGQGSVNWIHNISYTPPTGIEFLNSPTLGDIDGDNVIELLILDDKTLRCLDFLDVSSSGVTQWGSLKGSMYHTGQMDRDGDFLDDVNEQFYGTLMADWDTDNDFISDGWEAFLGTDPLDADTDNDGLSDGDEINVHNTDPNKADTDSDLMPDGWEIENGLDPLVDDADDDEDFDSLTNLGEYNNDTDPFDSDSDDDGALDGYEVFTSLTDPNDSDSDDDTILDGEEVIAGVDGWVTDPNDADTDGDGIDDGAEVLAGTDPTDPNDPPPSTSPTASSPLFGSLISIIALVSISFIVVALLQRKRNH